MRGSRRRIRLANCWPEFACPLPHRFMADDDAAGGQQLLYHTQPEREAEIQPDGVADDLGGEPAAGVAGASGCCHPTRLLTLTRRRKCPIGHQVDGAVPVALDPTAANRLLGGQDRTGELARQEMAVDRRPLPFRRRSVCDGSKARGPSYGAAPTIEIEFGCRAGNPFLTRARKTASLPHLAGTISVTRRGGVYGVASA